VPGTHAPPRKLTARESLAAIAGWVRRSLGEAFGDDASVAPRDRRTLAALMALAGALFFALAWQRHATFHARNFDLAFYARLAWGEAHLDGWEPIVDGHVYGLHFVWALELLGWVGALLGQVRTLLLAQSIAVALAAWPLARIGARVLRDPRARSGDLVASLGAYAGALAWLLHPNLSHVATNDFHPGTLATLPLAWCCEALHRRSAHGLAWSALGVLACREDLALVLVAFGLAFALATWHAPRRRGVGLAVAGLSALYVAVFLGYFHPRYAPATGSLELHFGRWGGSAPEVLASVLTRPGELFAWLAAPERAPYLVVITASLAFLPFLAPEWLLLAGPVLATNLLSAFPTTLFLDSHYLTPAVPALVAGALVGASRASVLLRGRSEVPLARPAFALPLCACAVLVHALAGGSPLGARFDREAYAPDARTTGIARALEAVPEGASVQAPERVLAHFAERRVLARPPPPERNTDYVVLDAWSRRVHRHRESLLRTDEEPILRDWLARTDHALVAAGGDLLVLARGRAPDEGLGRARFVRGRVSADEGRALTGCLALAGAELRAGEHGTSLLLTLAARGPCDSDLALRIGWGYRPGRVDLVADGLLSPAQFRAGDRIESVHPMSDEEVAAIRRHGLRVGAIRQSGARPAHDDPVALDVPLP
jgi:uncharacterized membrane protein